MRFREAVILRPAIIFYVALFILKGVAFASHIDNVRATVYAWAHAWQRQNITQYMSFYSPAFRSKGLDYQGWLNKKAKLFQKPVNIQVEISDLWVFIEGKRATARFVQHYQDPNAVDIGEKTLLLINTNDKWVIISEEWAPLTSPAPTSEKRTTIIDQQTLDPKSQTTDKDTLHPHEIIIKNIQFHVEKDYEKVCLNLNKFYIPVIFSLENKKPRIVVDIKDVYVWTGDDTTPVNGRLIKQIRTYLHRKINKLRIVIDLNPAKDYVIDQSYNPTEYIYCVEVK